MTQVIHPFGGYRKTLAFTYTCLTYHATCTFCQRNYPFEKDPLGKTSGQMIGAARSARQNIVEGHPVQEQVERQSSNSMMLLRHLYRNLQVIMKPSLFKVVLPHGVSLKPQQEIFSKLLLVNLFLVIQGIPGMNSENICCNYANDLSDTLKLKIQFLQLMQSFWLSTRQANSYTVRLNRASPKLPKTVALQNA